MRRQFRMWLAGFVGLAVGFASLSAEVHADCAKPDAALKVSRIVEIDASNGPIFGSFTRQEHEPSFLKPMEVVLTFDDGPMPWVTKSILDTLDAFCTKATFFSVGQMALAYPNMSKEVLVRGHTLGTHTYTHPFNMQRMKQSAATREIELGIAAVTTAAGAPIAPFFRFTGLSDSSRLLAYLQTRGIATFTVDVVSNDSYIHDPARLTERTMAEVRQQHGGIILFHDIKTTTAKALPAILARLKAEGYSVVHMTSKHPVEPQADAMSFVAPKLSTARNGEKGGNTLLPFYGALGSEKVAASKEEVEVSSLAPAPKARVIPPERPEKSLGAKTKASVSHLTANTKPNINTTSWMKSSIHDMGGPPAIVVGHGDADANGWVTKVQHRTIKHSAATTP